MTITEFSYINSFICGLVADLKLCAPGTKNLGENGVTSLKENVKR